MSVEGNDGRWQGLNGEWYNSETEANTAGSRGADNNVALDTAATVGFFAILFIKLYLWLIKKGVIPCLALAGGVAAFVGIPYGLITKTQFMTTAPNALYIVFGICFVFGMIAWNTKKILLVPLCAMFLITVVYVFMVKKHVIEVPDYMWITRLPEGFAQSRKSGDFRYSVSETGDSIIIRKFNGKKVIDVEIPEQINGLPVVKIDNNAFNSNELMRVIIPEGVTDIGNYAFANCYALINVTLPKSLRYMSPTAFEKCQSLTTSSRQAIMNADYTGKLDEEYTYAAYYYDGVEAFENEDYKKAFDLFVKADELGDPVASWMIAEFYRTGSGVEKDIDKALQYYEKTVKSNASKSSKDRARERIKALKESR